MIVISPNLFFWSDRLKLLMGRWKYQPSGTLDHTHLRWYTGKSMRALLRADGFITDRFVADGWMPLPGLRFVIGEHRCPRRNHEYP